MRWSQPEQFFWLIPWCLLGVWMLRARGRKRAVWRVLGRDDTPPASGLLRLWLSALMVILALAGPRWGRAVLPPPPPGRDVVLLVDVSLSMAAGDADPSRLEVARTSARSLLISLGQRAGEQAALVIFASRPELRVPLTTNLGAVSEGLDLLEAGELTPAGSNLAAGLAMALEAFGPIEPADGRCIVVLSDGEDHGSDLAAVLQRVRSMNIAVHVVAIGDSRSPGATIPARGLRTPPTPDGLLRYQGQVVHTRREDATLSRIAEATGGAFITAGLTPVDLGMLDQTEIVPRAALARQAILTRELADRRNVPLVSGLLLLIPWRGWLRQRPAPVLISLIACASLPMLGAAGVDLAGLARRGLTAFQARQWQDAAASYQALLAAQPQSALAHYNLAEVHAAQGDHDLALRLYLHARDLRPQPLLLAKIDFATGNLHVSRGQYRDAMSCYDRVLGLRIGRSEAFTRLRRDAEMNREFARQQLERERVRARPDDAPDQSDQRQPGHDPTLDQPDAEKQPRPATDAAADASKSTAPESSSRAAAGATSAQRAPPGTTRLSDISEREQGADAPPGQPEDIAANSTSTTDRDVSPSARLQREIERIQENKRKTRAAAPSAAVRNFTDERPW